MHVQCVWEMPISPKLEKSVGPTVFSKSSAPFIQLDLYSITFSYFCKRLPSHWSRAGLHWHPPFSSSVGRHNAKNGLMLRKTVTRCAPLIISMWNTFPEKERGIIGPASRLHGWHWVMLFFYFWSLNTFVCCVFRDVQIIHISPDKYSE